MSLNWASEGYVYRVSSRREGSRPIHRTYLTRASAERRMEILRKYREGMDGYYDPEEGMWGEEDGIPPLEWAVMERRPVGEAEEMDRYDD